MKYSHNYRKLSWDEYTTIRRYPKGKVGDVVLETYPRGKHYARIKKIEREALFNIPLDLLIFDTDLGYREEIYALFQSFYKKPINFVDEKFYLYYLEKVKK